MKKIRKKINIIFPSLFPCLLTAGCSSETVHFHSIIGNRKEALIPGGTDGIVPYWSSHLDHADSELIVKSDHSVHSSPVAIQEVRQLLLLHIGKRKHSLSEKIQGEW